MQPKKDEQKTEEYKLKQTKKEIMKCLLIPILIGLISAILGYLLGRLSKGNNENERKKIAELEAALAACRKENRGSNVQKNAGIIPYDAKAAKAIFGKSIKHNDLTVVEGIGPKIQGLFHENGVDSWKKLAACSVATCQKVLDSGGEKFKLHTPTTWPKQAQLAYEGKWQELFDWQEKLDGGV